MGGAGVDMELGLCALAAQGNQPPFSPECSPTCNIFIQ